MVEISASMVMKLRKISGQGMMDCKKALEQANGDADQAMEILRKKGLVTLSKRAGRETSEGIVVGRVSEDGKVGTLAVLCCETDFSAKSDDFIAAAEKLAEYAMKCPADEGVQNILDTSIEGKSFADILTGLVSKTGEKTQVGDFARFRLDGPGLVSVYVHFNQKVGSMLRIEAASREVAEADAVKRVAADIAMHITATNPLALDKDGIEPKIIEQEKAIYADQVKNKPANIVDKIVEGKLRKFYAENCLLEQAFVKDDSKSVRQVLDEAAARAGGQAMIKRFVRFAVG
ncbi:MAG: translation elongation factor Ts [Phycisphaerales bacterium]|nr:MAG: translation elongation factor Ts [Phycisphaerales bacterium]